MESLKEYQTDKLATLYDLHYVLLDCLIFFMLIWHYFFECILLKIMFFFFFNSFTCIDSRGDETFVTWLLDEGIIGSVISLFNKESDKKILVFF